MSLERRESILTDVDIEKIESMIVRERTAWAESIGYDVSSAAARAEIRKDHELVRDLRQAKGKILGAFFTGFGSSVVLWIWTAFKVMDEVQR